MQDFEINKKKFFNFLNKIDENETIEIIAHGNCNDGLISALFMSEILKKRFPGVKIKRSFFSYTSGLFDKITEDYELNGINKVFVLDFNADADFLEEFQRFINKFDVLFVDHHPLNSNLIVDDKVIKTPSVDCTSLFLYKVGEESLKEPEFVELACIASISEFSYKSEENLKFIQDHCNFDPKDYQDSEIFKKVLKIGSLVTYYSSREENAYQIILEKNQKEIERIDKEVSDEFNRCLVDFEQNSERHFNNHLYFYFFKSKFPIGSSLGTSLSVKHKGSTLIVLSDKDKDFFKVSARNNGVPLKYSMNEMLKSGIEGLSNSSAGGHAPASGASFLKKDLDTFKKQILEFVSSKIGNI